MVLGALLGAGIGLVGGVSVGSLVFGSKDKKSFSHLDVAADGDESVREPTCQGPIKSDMRQVLELSPAWTKWPDYERVAWVNRMIESLWPHYNKAVADIVYGTVTPVLANVAKGIALVDSIDIENMDLGNKPLKLGGFKTYETREDEVIMEAPLLWGSNSDIRVSARIKLGPIAIYAPVVIRNIQLHAVARITIRPLVETLPCLGAVHIALLNPPHLDMTLLLINGIDLMALPGVKGKVNNIVQSVIGNLMLYPNQLTVDLMEGGGLPAPPSGMLQVELKKVEGLKNMDTFSKNDTYVLFEVREGRPQRSKTVKGTTVEFDDDPFYFIVDDPETQYLKITVMDDDFGWSDKVLGVANRLLENEPFMEEVGAMDMVYEISKEDEKPSVGKSVRKLATTLSQKVGKEDGKQQLSQGRVQVKVTYYPFFRPDTGDEEEEDEGVKGPNRHMQFSRMKTISNVRDEMKGLLSITLTRCMNLAGKDTYVLFSVHDNVAMKTAERKSIVVANDSNPRWGDKFDFVMINANSTVVVTVIEKVGFLESVMKLTKKAEDKDRPIGSVEIPVRDVVRNGRLKDVWPLQEVQQGEIALTLTWTAVEIAV